MTNEQENLRLFLLWHNAEYAANGTPNGSKESRKATEAMREYLRAKYGKSEIIKDDSSH